MFSCGDYSMGKKNACYFAGRSAQMIATSNIIRAFSRSRSVFEKPEHTFIPQCL